MIKSRSIRHVQDVTLYPEEIGIRTWYRPRQLFYQRSRFKLDTSTEFNQRIKPLIPQDEWWSLPLFFRVFDVTKTVAREKAEWEKMQALMRLDPSRTLKALPPWQALALYEADRRGVTDLLLKEEDSTNTFYVGRGLSHFAMKIEHDPEEAPESTSDWYADTFGLGDSQLRPFRQRIFVGL